MSQALDLAIHLHRLLDLSAESLNNIITNPCYEWGCHQPCLKSIDSSGKSVVNPVNMRLSFLDDVLY